MNPSVSIFLQWVLAFLGILCCQAESLANFESPDTGFPFSGWEISQQTDFERKVEPLLPKERNASHEVKSQKRSFDKQIPWLLSRVNFPHLSQNNLKLLVKLAELKTQQFFLVNRRKLYSQDLRSFHHNKVKTQFFLSYIRILLFDHGGISQWLIDDPLLALGSRDFISGPIAANRWDWLGFAEVLDQDGKFKWQLNPLMARYPLFDHLVITLLLAQNLQTRLKLNKAISWKDFKRTEKSQILLSSIAREILIFKIMNFDFVRTAIYEQIDRVSLSLSRTGIDLDKYFEKMRASEDEFSHLNAWMFGHMPRSFLSPNNLAAISYWVDNNLNLPMDEEAIIKTLEDFERNFFQHYKDQNEFNLARLKKSLFKNGLFLEYMSLLPKGELGIQCRSHLSSVER